MRRVSRTEGTASWGWVAAAAGLAAATLFIASPLLPDRTLSDGGGCGAMPDAGPPAAGALFASRAVTPPAPAAASGPVSQGIYINQGAQTRIARTLLIASQPNGWYASRSYLDAHTTALRDRL